MVKIKVAPILPPSASEVSRPPTPANSIAESFAESFADSNFSSTTQSAELTAMLGACGFMVNCSYWIYAIPYRYDRKRKQLVFDTRRRYKLGPAVYSLLVMLFAGFLLTQSARTVLTEDIPVKYHPRLYVLTVGFCHYAAGQMIGVAQGQEFPAVFNHITKAERHLRGLTQVHQF